jgi:AmpE protein
MSFLAMLIALAMQQLLHPGNPFQRDDWLLSWDAFVARQLPGRGFAALLTLAALLLLASWLLGVVEHWFFGLAELLLTAWIFLWSLGREDYHTALEQLQARQVGEATASPAVDALWVPGRAADVSTAAVADPAQQDHAEDPQAPDDPEVRQRKALERLTYAGYARWFAPLFFFVLTGPLGALLYRAVALLARRDRNASYVTVLAWLDWVPARLLVLGFALIGDFLAVSRQGALRHFTDASPAPQLLAEAAVRAGDEDTARAVGDVLYRSAGLWLLLISIGLLLS